MKKGHVNHGYVTSPPQYGSPYRHRPEPVVVINQPMPVKRDYSMPGALVAGILMVIAAAINLICFIAMVIFHLIIFEFIVGCAIYAVAGGLAIFCAVRKQSSIVCAAFCLMMSIAALCMSVAQIIFRAIGLIAYSAQRPEEESVLYVNIALLVIAFICFCLSIALIIMGSQVLCCGTRTTPASRGVVYAKNQAMPVHRIEHDY